MYSNEMVLVVPTALFHQVGYFQGFSANVKAYQKTLLAPENVLFRPRQEVELDPDFKQLIPYMIFCYTENSTGRRSVFTYTRGKGMGEARLHSKMSIGVGGHLNNQDIGSGTAEDANRFRDLYHEGMRRELYEEVRLKTNFTEQCVGMINDDETEVGKVHLGVVHRLDVESPDVVSNEVDLIESGFRPVDELLNLPPERFESWSSICLNALFR